MEEASADVLAGRGTRPGPLQHVWPEPIVRKPHNGVFKRLENVPHHDEELLPLPADTRSVRMVLLRELAERDFEALVVDIWENAEDLIEVGRHGARGFDEVVGEVGQDDQSESECILFAEDDGVGGRWDDGGAVEEEEEMAGQKVGDDGPPDEAQQWQRHGARGSM